MAAGGAGGAGLIPELSALDLAVADWMIDSQHRLRQAVNEVVSRQAIETIWTRH